MTQRSALACCELVHQRIGHPADQIRWDLHAVGLAQMRPGSPWQNPWVESYEARMREELLAIEQFSSLLEAQVLRRLAAGEYNNPRQRCHDGTDRGPGAG